LPPLRDLSRVYLAAPKGDEQDSRQRNPRYQDSIAIEIMNDERSVDILSGKIRNYCRLRLSPILPSSELAKVQAYLLDLSARRAVSPRTGRGVNWRAFADFCQVEYSVISEARDAIRPVLDAISRALLTANERPLESSDYELSEPARPTKEKSAPKVLSRVKAQAKAPKISVDPEVPRRSAVPRAARNVSRNQPEEFPRPLYEQLEDPISFDAALTYQARRHGETSHRLYRAVVRPNEPFDRRTLRSWMDGAKVPLTTTSLEILRRIERRYQLPNGYFQDKLPPQSRAAPDFDLGDIKRAERRRLVWHLPSDFNSLSPSKKEEIIEWVRRVIISGATEYRRFHAGAAKQRYAIRFPGVTYGRSTPLARSEQEDAIDDEVPDTDPDLLSGVIDAPPQLSMEMSGLVSFKTSTLTAFGLQRNGVWGEETTSQQIEHLGLMLGALAASPQAKVRGYGVPLQHLTLGLLAFPAVWDWYVQWRERRRGFYTMWEVGMLRTALALTRQETGWLRQHGNLARRVRPIPGLVSPQDIESALHDWDGTCDALFKHATGRAKEIQKIARVHRDPFEAIMPVLEAPGPVAEYRKITEEILRRMPDHRRYPRAAAESVRAFLMLRLGLHLGLRQKNLRQLMICPRGKLPRSERLLTDMKRGELRWSERDSGWEVLIPAAAFKNSDSSYFGGKPFRLMLPNLGELYDYIEEYVERYRTVLLNGADDPGTFFVKTVKKTSKDAEYNQTTFYEAWRLAIQRYGIYNPYTGRGAIAGLLPHGPHNIRDVLATHILKQTGSFEQASYAIQDTPEMVAKHYGRFLPQDKAALAAKILNQVWEAA